MLPDFSTDNAPYAASLANDIAAHLARTFNADRFAISQWIAVVVSNVTPSRRLLSRTARATLGIHENIRNVISGDASAAANSVADAINSNSLQLSDSSISIVPQSASTENTSSSSSSGLSGGAIAGIVVGVVVGVALLCLVVFVVFFHTRGTKGREQIDAGESEISRSHPDTDASEVEMENV